MIVPRIFSPKKMRKKKFFSDFPLDSVASLIAFENQYSWFEILGF